MSNTEVNKKVTIIGAGWLGAPLTLSLLRSHKKVVATKQSPESCKELLTRFSDLTPFPDALTVIPFSDKLLKTEAISLKDLHKLFHARQVIITIPPTPFIQRYTHDNQREGIQKYADFIQKISQLAEEHHALEIIYTSSISVYGNSSGIIHEELPAMPQSNSAKAVFAAEKSLQNRTIPITILRLAGLIGHGRHPIFSLQGRENIRSPFNAINLLHINDLIRAILTILERSKIPQSYDIYNLVTPFHPNRQSYYQTLAKQCNLSLPQFETPKPELKRIIDGGKISEQGDFNYEEIDLLQSSLKKIL